MSVEAVKFCTSMMPGDWRSGRFVGRMDFGDGPSPVLIVNGDVLDLSPVAATVAEAAALDLQSERPVKRLGTLECVLDAAAARLLAPVDLQAVKASGVTFVRSTIERVIEERAGGDPERATNLRARLEARVGAELRAVAPGSAKAAALKAALVAEGAWSPYLEVAIGPDAEIFTKAQPMSAVGAGMPIGVRSDSEWNNPEPEVVLLMDPSGRPVGATLGNDVNLRDFEGRSALLLGKAKDNNASCSLGPFVRLFDADFGMDDVRDAVVTLTIEGPDGFRLEGRSEMREISRDPVELVRQSLSEHQYPDGLALFLGTGFAPVQDRDGSGRGFSHRIGDIVTIRSPRLGTLLNPVTTSAAAEPWTFGVAALMRNLAGRGLLSREAG